MLIKGTKKFIVYRLPKSVICPIYFLSLDQNNTLCSEKNFKSGMSHITFFYVGREKSSEEI